MFLFSKKKDGGKGGGGESYREIVDDWKFDVVMGGAKQTSIHNPPLQ